MDKYPNLFKKEKTLDIVLYVTYVFRLKSINTGTFYNRFKFILQDTADV